MATISVDFPNDPKLGYLSYRHREPIDIQGEIWPSIERYILAKTLPEKKTKIRTIVSESSIQRLTKPRSWVEVRPDGSVVKIRTKVSPATIDFSKELIPAFEAKFSPRLSEFLSTFPYSFSSKIDPEYAEALTKFRNAKYAEKINAERIKIDLTSDLPETFVRDTEILFRIWARYVKKLKKIEGVKKDYLGLYDDALWNLCPQEKVEKILGSVKIDYVLRHMPRQKEVISKCYDFLGKKFPKEISKPTFRKIADTAWVTFRWQIFTGMNYHTSLKSKQLKLKPVARPYRKVKTKAGHLKSLVVRSEEYARLFGDREDYEDLVETYEEMSPMKRELAIEKLLNDLSAKKEKEKEKKVKITESDEPEGIKESEELADLEKSEEVDSKDEVSDPVPKSSSPIPEDQDENSEVIDDDSEDIEDSLEEFIEEPDEIISE